MLTGGGGGGAVLKILDSDCAALVSNESCCRQNRFYVTDFFDLLDERKFVFFLL